MAIKKVFGTYRHKWTNEGVRYTPSYFLNKQFKDYLEAGLTKTLDQEIPENRYTAEIAPGIKKQTRFIIGEYEDTVIDPIAFKDNIAKVGAEFNIDMFNTPLEALERLKDNTNLKYLGDITDDSGNIIGGKFEIYPEHTDEITGQLVPAKILEIV